MKKQTTQTTLTSPYVEPERFRHYLKAAVAASPELRSLQFVPPSRFGVNYTRPEDMMTRRTLSDEEVTGYIGKEKSAILNFTGMMLEGIAMQEISEWIERSKRRKIKEYRQYTRPMERAMAGYLATVEEYWSDRMDIYSHYFDLTLSEFQRELRVYLHMGMDNEICRQLPATKDREAALQLCFTIEMLRRSNALDVEKMRMLSKAAGRRVVRDADPNVEAMIAACRRMQKELGITVEVTPPIREVIEVFRNRLQAYCARLLAEEHENLKNSQSHDSTT